MLSFPGQQEENLEYFAGRLLRCGTLLTGRRRFSFLRMLFLLLEEFHSEENSLLLIGAVLYFLKSFLSRTPRKATQFKKVEEAEAAGFLVYAEYTTLFFLSSGFWGSKGGQFGGIYGGNLVTFG